MCNPLKPIKKLVGGVFGGGEAPAPIVDNSAEIARQQEEERQKKILEGQNSIEGVFKQFTPDYYSGVSKNYLDYYAPQLDDQYNNALEQLAYKLARGGNSLSSTGNEQSTKLFEVYNTKKQQLANEAADAAARIRGNVEAQKSDLFSLNSSSADPQLAASRASAAVSSLAAPTSYSPLADVFASFLNSGANANLIAKNNAAVENLPSYNWNQKDSGKLVGV